MKELYDVVVIGGGFAAAEESVFLTKYARHVTVLIRGKGFSCAPSAPVEAEELPCVWVCRANDEWSGLAFHGAPGGHEFTSFVLVLYNTAGPGQPLDEKNAGRCGENIENSEYEDPGLPVLHDVSGAGNGCPAHCGGESFGDGGGL